MIVPKLSSPFLQPQRVPLAAAAVALAGLAIELIAFWPGLMSVDSNAQYIQALSGRYSDNHPPVMAWLWSATNRVAVGPAGMLIVHLGMLWTGLFAIALGARRRGVRHAWIVPIVGALPFVAHIAGVIWKDVGMSYAFLCGSGLLYASKGTRWHSRVALVASAAVLIAYGAMVRVNAPVVAFPLACYAVSVLRPRIGPARVVAAGAISIAIVLSIQQVIERSVIATSRVHASQMLMLFDLAGIACGGGRVDIPPAFRSHDDEAGLCRVYDADQADTLFFAAGPLRMTSLDDGALRTLRSAWLAAIGAHPVLYLSHRARAFGGLLGLHPVRDDYRYLLQREMTSNPWGFAFVPNALSSALFASVDSLADSGLYTGAFWVGLAFVLLVVIAIRRAPAPFEVALLVAGLMNALPYFFISLAANYRYLHWTVLATVVSALLLTLRRKSSTGMGRAVTSEGSRPTSGGADVDAARRRHRSSRRRVSASAM